MSNFMEVLNGFDPQQIVFVGSDTAWFDVARAGEMRQDKYIKGLSRQQKREFEKMARNAQISLYNLLKNPPAWGGLVEGDTMEHSIEKYMETLQAHQETIRRAQNNVIKAKQRVDSFVPLWEREVKEVYPRISDSGICVSLFGEERGKYWLIEEKYPDGIPLFEAT